MLYFSRAIRRRMKRAEYRRVQELTGDIIKSSRGDRQVSDSLEESSSVEYMDYTVTVYFDDAPGRYTIWVYRGIGRNKRRISGELVSGTFDTALQMIQNRIDTIRVRWGGGGCK